MRRIAVTVPPRLSRRTGVARFLLPGLLALSVGSLARPMAAATFTWNGVGADVNWSTAANWAGGAAPVSDGTADLQFAGTLGLTPFADSAYSLRSLAFNSGAGAFTLGGGALTLGGGLTQNSAGTQTINNPITLGATQTWVVNAGRLTLGGTINNAGKTLTVYTAMSAVAATFNGALSGGGGLVKTGAGTLTLAGANTYSEPTSVTAGSLTFAAGSSLSGGNSISVRNDAVLNVLGSMTLAGASTLLVDGTNAVTATATLAGGGTLAVFNEFVGYNGIGTFTQSGGSHTVSNQFILGYNTGSNGTYNLGGGVLQVGRVSQGPGSGTFNFNGGTLRAKGDTTSFIGVNFANVQASGALIDSNGFGVTVGQSLQHDPALGATADGGLTKLGAGTLTLTGANTYTGATTVNAGTLTVGSGGSLNGTTGTALAFTGGGTFNVAPAANVSQGMGALSFAAGEANVQSTYAGSGNAGLSFSSLAARATGATGNFVLSGGTNGTTNQITLAGTGAGFLNQGLFFGGSSYAWVDAATPFVRAINYGVDSGTVSSAGAASVSGDHILTTGAITAQPTATFLTLKLASNDAVTLTDGATLTVNGILKAGNTAGGGATISGGSGVQAASDAELVIRADGNNNALTIATPILANGTNALTKSGAGTLTLTAVNTYTGTTTVNAGTLQASSPGALPGYDTPGKVNVNATATLTVNVGGAGEWSGAHVDTLLGAATFRAGSALGLDTTNAPAAAFTYNTSLGGVLGLTKSGVGALTLTGTNTYSGATTVNGGSLTFAAGSSLAGGGSTVVNAGATLNALGSVSLGSNALTLDGSSASPASATLAGGGTLAVGTEYVGNQGTGSFIQSGGTHTFLGNLYLGNSAGSSGTYSLSGGSLWPLSEYVGNQGTGTFNQTAGTHRVGNTFYLGNSAGSSGTYNLSGGLMDIPQEYVGYNGTGSFTQSAGSHSVNNDLILAYNNPGSRGTYNLGGTGALTVGGSEYVGYNGTGSFTQSGGSHRVGNTLYLGYSAGNGTYSLGGGVLQVGSVSQGKGSGTFNFNGGTLRAASSTTTFMGGLSAANVQAGGAFINTNGFNVNVAQPLLNGVSGTDGGLTKLGSGTLTLTGANTYTGATTVSGGSLAVGNDPGATTPSAGRLTGTSALTINNGGTFLLADNAAVTDRLNDAAPVTLRGGGKLATAGLSEGTAPTGAKGSGGVVGMGPLIFTNVTSSLAAVLDFGSGGTPNGGSALVFSYLDTSGKGAFVNVLNWSGTAGADNGASGNDRLLFAVNPGFTTADLANWQFRDDAGTPFATGATQIAYNGYYELVPAVVPEAGTWVAGAVGVLACAGSLRRRRREQAKQADALSRGSWPVSRWTQRSEPTKVPSRVAPMTDGDQRQQPRHGGRGGTRRRGVTGGKRSSRALANSRKLCVCGLRPAPDLAPP